MELLALIYLSEKLGPKGMLIFISTSIVLIVSSSIGAKLFRKFKERNESKD